MGPSRRLDETFRYSVTLKGIDGALEMIGGLILVFVSPARLDHLARTVFHHELPRHQDDFLAAHILKSTDDLVHGGRAYAATYLLLHGLSKVVLVIALLQRRTWAYPWMIALLGVFVAYQCYRMTYKPSVGMALLTIFDVFVMWLTWREWRSYEPVGRGSMRAA